MIKAFVEWLLPKIVGSTESFIDTYYVDNHFDLTYFAGSFGIYAFMFLCFCLITVTVILYLFISRFVKNKKRFDRYASASVFILSIFLFVFSMSGVFDPHVKAFANNTVKSVEYQTPTDFVFSGQNIVVANDVMIPPIKVERIEVTQTSEIAAFNFYISTNDTTYRYKVDHVKVNNKKASLSDIQKIENLHKKMHRFTIKEQIKTFQIPSFERYSISSKTLNIELTDKPANENDQIFKHADEVLR